MYIPNTINENTITLILNNRPKIVPKSHMNFLKIKCALIEGKHDKVPNLLDIVGSVSEISGGEFTIVNGEVRYQGRLVPSYQSQKLISMLKEGRQDVNPLKNFIGRLMNNPSARARDEFARFADYKELPFDAEGFVYAYRGLKDDFYSRTGNTETRVLKGKVNSQGQIYNGVGEEIEVERADVDDDCTRTCSYGVHAGSFDYARGWSGGKLVLVKIDPKDIVSVPVDCDGQKVRVCHYWVVSEYVEDTDIKRSVISDKVPTKKNGKPKTEKDCLNYFKKIVAQYDLNHKDSDLIYSYMERGGYGDFDVDSLIYDLEIAEKIQRYIDRQGGEVSLKRIQSALKAYSLKYADIERIVETYGDITDTDLTQV
jgi:hypothetical protein